MKTKIFTLFIFLIICATSYSQDVTYSKKILPTDDTYVQPGKDAQGGADFINSKTDLTQNLAGSFNRFSFMKFDLSEINENVDKAVLNLTWIGKQSDTITGNHHQLFELDPAIAWEEETMVFDTAVHKFSSDPADTATWFDIICGEFKVENPTYQANLVADYELPPVEDLETNFKLIEIDLTDFVNANKGQVVSFALFDFFEFNKQVKIASKEHTNENIRPFIGLVSQGATAPVVDVAMQDVSYDQGFESDTIDISDVFSDPNGDELTVTAESSDENVATVAIAEGNLIITEVGTGQTTITLTATDGTESISDEFVITVEEVDDILIKNGDFETGELAPWTTYLPSWIDYITADFAVVEGEAAVTNIVIGDPNHADNPQEAFAWHISLRQIGVRVEKGINYILTFDAYSSENRNINLFLGKENGDITYFGNDNLEITSEKKNYRFEFTMEEETDENSRLSFDLGLETPSFYVDNVSLVDASNATAVKLSSVQSNFQVYPNPSTDVVNLSFKNETEKSIKIIDITGALVYSKITWDKSDEINVSQWRKGIYFVYVNGYGVQKIIVN